MGSCWWLSTIHKKADLSSTLFLPMGKWPYKIGLIDAERPYTPHGAGAETGTYLVKNCRSPFHIKDGPKIDYGDLESWIFLSLLYEIFHRFSFASTQPSPYAELPINYQNQNRSYQPIYWIFHSSSDCEHPVDLLCDLSAAQKPSEYADDSSRSMQLNWMIILEAKMTSTKNWWTLMGNLCLLSRKCYSVHRLRLLADIFSNRHSMGIFVKKWGAIAKR